LQQGHEYPSVLAAGFVIATNLFLRPLMRRMNHRLLTATDAETRYPVEIVCRGAEEAHMRSLCSMRSRAPGLACVGELPAVVAQSQP
jgi:uncharacterized membrane protein YhiD involved in acid resistance